MNNSFNIFVSLLLLLAITSCQIDTSKQSNNNVETTPKKVGKKGIAYTNKNTNWSEKVEKLNVDWMYSWGHELHKDLPRDIEFVPMFWGKYAVNDDVIEKIKKYKKQNQIQYLLSFNEPDGSKQANMSVDETLELWPKLESIGLPLGSPAAIHADREWMQEFMHKADSLDYRVDFITVHHYDGPNVSAFIQKLEKIHKMYKRPIWITELGVGDWKAKTIEENKHSEEKVGKFVEELLPALDTLDFVHRYAWFDGGKNYPALYTSKFFDEDLNLTVPGKIYAEYQLN